MDEYGPKTLVAQETHKQKYRSAGESFYDACIRGAQPITDDEEHFRAYKNLTLTQKFLPAGRIQSAVGSPRNITSFNCFVSGKISDSMNSIMLRAKDAAQTMRLGGGEGFSFSAIRPRNSMIKTLDAPASGAVSFMSIFDSVCSTVSSAGDRRGAMMGVLRIDHPDIEEFIDAKCNEDKLTNFNLSVGVTDEFMKAVVNDGTFKLRFQGKVYKKVGARALFDKLMRATWDWAEPGVLFIDRINEYNNLYYCEVIECTNPCQPSWATILTPDGVRDIGSINTGNVIWSEDGWVEVVDKWSTGIQDVYKYRTNSGVFYGTKNHKVLDSGVKTEVDNAVTIDSLQGDVPVIAHMFTPQVVMDGLVLGDGSVHKAYNNLVFLHIGKNDGDYFTSEVGYFINGHRPGLKATAYDVKTNILPEELPYTYQRRVPAKYLNGDRTTVCSFLRGLYSANGSVVRDRVTLKTSSIGLVEDVQIMLSSIGIASYYITNRPKEVQFSNGEYICKQSYDINITVHSGEFLRSVGFLQKYKEEKLAKVARVILGKESYDITEVEYVSTEEVFDITVSGEHHTYWTGGCNVANCGEQPLPPNGACLLGSFNLVKYINDGRIYIPQEDIDTVVRAFDNIIDYSTYPLDVQEEEAKSKRRMGIGVTGLANALESLGYTYGSPEFLEAAEAQVFKPLVSGAYKASVSLAKEKGSFPLFDGEKYLSGEFIKTLPKYIQEGIREHGIRNSHLISFAPTGTISLVADNVSSGIEPVFSPEYIRTIIVNGEPTTQLIKDYGVENFNTIPKTATECSLAEHLGVLALATKYCDSAVSKTINVGDNIGWEQFKQIYIDAWEAGCKGCTTFRAAGKRFGVLNEISTDDIGACYIDPQTGDKSCS